MLSTGVVPVLGQWVSPSPCTCCQYRWVRPPGCQPRVAVHLLIDKLFGKVRAKFKTKAEPLCETTGGAAQARRVSAGIHSC